MITKVKRNETNIVNTCNFDKQIITKDQILNLTNREIQNELNKKYKELQSEVNEWNDSTNAINQIIDVFERIYLIQYLIKCSNETNISNYQIIMNEIVHQLEYYEYYTDKFEVEIEQNQIKDIKQEVIKIIKKNN